MSETRQGVPVILCRMVAKHNDDPLTWVVYAKRVSLPIAPFVGLGIVLDEQCDPDKVESVFVNEDNELVCVMEAMVYGEREFDDADEWAEQLAWHTKGWTAVGHLPCLNSRKYKVPQP